MQEFIVQERLSDKNTKDIIYNFKCDGSSPFIKLTFKRLIENNDLWWYTRCENFKRILLLFESKLVQNGSMIFFCLNKNLYTKSFKEVFERKDSKMKLLETHNIDYFSRGYPTLFEPLVLRIYDFKNLKEAALEKETLSLKFHTGIARYFPVFFN